MTDVERSPNFNSEHDSADLADDAPVDDESEPEASDSGTESPEGDEDDAFAAAEDLLGRGDEPAASDPARPGVADVAAAEAIFATTSDQPEPAGEVETDHTVADESEPAETDAAASTVLADAEEAISEDELLEERPPAESPYDRPGRWFVVHTQSGYEKKVKQNLEARIQSMNAEDAVYEVVIPMEDYVDLRNGKRVVAQRKMFPGYLLVRSQLDDKAWSVIRNTPGVTGFVGQGAKPSPLRRRDVESFLAPKGTDAEVITRAKPRLEYEVGENVRVREGPFADFSGEIIDINEDQLRLKVLVNIFGRETPVELEFSKVAKL